MTTQLSREDAADVDTAVAKYEALDEEGRTTAFRNATEALFLLADTLGNNADALDECFGAMKDIIP